MELQNVSQTQVDPAIVNLASAIGDANIECKSPDGLQALLIKVRKFAPEFKKRAEEILKADKAADDAQAKANEAHHCAQQRHDSFTPWFAQHYLDVIALRKHFPKAGSPKKILIDGKEWGWVDFAESAFGVSIQFVNRKLAEFRDPDVDSEEAKKRSDAARKAGETRKKNAKRPGQDTGTTTVVTVTEAAEAEADKSDPYWHFVQFRDEKQTLANEIAGMLETAYPDDLQSIKDVLELAIKIAKKDLKK